MNTLGNRIRELRKKNNLNQTELSNALNRQFGLKTDRVMISKWETGFQTPVMSTISCIAKFFNVSIDYLNGNSDHLYDNSFPANRLKELRVYHGMNMKEVAEHLNIPYTTYVNYEKGTREPNSEMLIAMANFYGVSLDYLIGRKEQNNLSMVGSAPKISEDPVSFPVVGKIAAGYGVSPEWVKHFTKTNEETGKDSDPDLEDERQKLLSACSKLSVEDLKKVLEYVDFIKSKRND